METIQTAIKEFLGHCRFEKNLSEKTIKAYSIDLKQFREYLQKSDSPISLSEVTRIHIRGFLEDISELKPKTIKRKIAALKAMFNYLEFEDRIVVNPFRKMRIRINEPKQLPKVMDIREVNGIFRSAYNEVKTSEYGTFGYSISLRDVAVVELLFATGARVSEIANLKTDCIDLLTGNFLIKGKGNKERMIQICNPETLKILKDYSRMFKAQIKASEGYFLINRLGSKLSDQSIRGIVRKLTKEAKIPRHITPHVFRHSLATLLLEKDVDIKYIQSILGHSSIMTTQIYTHVNRKKQREIMRVKHPRRDFSVV